MSAARRHPADRGLAAVERVRGVRERDRRLGLVAALADLRAREARVAELEASLREHGAFAAGTVSEMGRFVALRASLEALHSASAEARARLASARTVAVDADAHWTSDRSRLGAVEGLLERRGDERRAERGRVEAAALDEVAAQGWLRRRDAATEQRGEA
jgi:flagellar export protein FliJ